MGEIELETKLQTCPVLNVPVGILTMDGVIETINHWIKTSERTRLVSFVNVHMVVEAQLRPQFHRVLDRLDLNCPDGAPIYWMVRRLFGEHVEKVSGPELMPRFCEQSVARGHRHFFYGGAPGVARDAAAALERDYPGIQVVGHLCPPFRTLTAAETDHVVEEINSSGADVVWVCLGCPKQETWMDSVRDRLNVKVVLSVGQAFDILAGRKQRAPELLRKIGAEWAYRLIQEPRRLWKRYFLTNLLFAMLLFRRLINRESLASGWSRGRAKSIV